MKKDEIAFVANKKVELKEEGPGTIEYYRFLPHYTLIHEVTTVPNFYTTFAGASSLTSISFPKVSSMTGKRKTKKKISSTASSKSYTAYMERLIIRLPDSYTLVAIGNDKSYFTIGSSQSEEFKDPFKLTLAVNLLFGLATEDEKREIYQCINNFIVNNFTFSTVIVDESSMNDQLLHDYTSFIYDKEEKTDNSRILTSYLNDGYEMIYEVNNKLIPDFRKEYTVNETGDVLYRGELYLSNKFMVYKGDKQLIEITHCPSVTENQDEEAVKLATTKWVNNSTFSDEKRNYYLNPITCFEEIKSKCPDLNPLDQCKIFGYIQRFVKGNLIFVKVKKRDSVIIN